MPTAWKIYAKITDDSAIGGDFLWGAVVQYWPNYTFTLSEGSWSIIEQSKIQDDTTWSINAKTKIQTATEV